VNAQGQGYREDIVKRTSTVAPGHRTRAAGGARRALSPRLLTVAGALALALAGAAPGSGVSALGAAPSAPALTAPVEAPCASATNATVAGAVGQVAQRIYLSELSSSEVRADRRQVEGDAPLLAALAAGAHTGVHEAVTRLVYSGTHIVRLRVSSGGSLISDVGGPYILAPVSGSLRTGGRTVGHYVLSVQDDLGYVKLETRFIGLPVWLREGARPVPIEGVIKPGSTFVPEHGLMRYAGRSYLTLSFAARAFLGGPLRITVLVPVSHPSSAGCTLVRAAELARIGRVLWKRVDAIGAPVNAYPALLRGLTGALAYVRAGRVQLLGSGSPGPRQIPDSGELSYHGVMWLVSSFPSSVGGRAVRVYQLIAR
jgi:hypothetical protein